MTIIEKIEELKQAKVAFKIYLSDGREFDIPSCGLVDIHKKGLAGSITVFDPSDRREHWIPNVSITGISIMRQAEKDGTETKN